MTSLSAVVSGESTAKLARTKSQEPTDEGELLPSLPQESWRLEGQKKERGEEGSGEKRTEIKVQCRINKVISEVSRKSKNSVIRNDH